VTVYCVRCGSLTEVRGSEGHRTAYECPKCYAVQIESKAVAPGTEVCPVPCIYLYKDTLTAAGQLPSVFQRDLF
jgi:hypothetical protein